MMKTKQYIFLLIFFFRCALAGDQDSLSNHTLKEGYDSSRPYLMLVYDPNFMERAGAEDILALHYGITRAEDKIIGTRWFSENTFSGKTGGVLVRFTKTVLLDAPLDGLSFIFAHEYFGHGVRLQELSDREIKYHISMPLYGGKHSCAYPVGSIPLSYQGLFAIQEGGIEAQVILNRDIAMGWMTTDEMQYRDAFLYLISILNYYPSTVHTPENSSIYDIQNDPSGYLLMLNIQAGFNGVNNLKMNQKAFHSRMALSIINPFIFYSMYCFFKTYLWDGNTISEFPAFQIGDIRYLPVLRSGMTPFGIEYHLENYLRYGNTTSLIDFRVGDQTFHSLWGGLGLSFQNIASWNRCSADINVDLWKQPELVFGGSQVIWDRNRILISGTPGVSKGGGIGGAISIRGYYLFNTLNNSISAVAELGYKSVGFLEGYNLDASPIFMIGIGFHP